jgi:SHS2 domain-containing protein
VKPPMHELFEHTADLGLRATAPDLPSLFAEMAKCLLSAIVEEPAAVEQRHECTIMLGGTDREYLMFDWLRHLLYLFDEGKKLYCEFEIIIEPDGLSAIAFGEEYDLARHVLAHEVKAITYHELKVEQTAGGWLAEVIVDI